MYRIEKKSFNYACVKVIDQVIFVWNKARIPTTRKDNAINKFKKLYNQLLYLFKHKDRKTELHRQQVCGFRLKMANLFDIGDADALKKIMIEEDRQFLLTQRELGRRGFISTEDVFTTQKDNRKMEREEKLRLYKEKVANRNSSNIYDFTSSDTEENHSSDNSSDDDFKVKEKKLKKVIASKKKLKPLITPELAGVLDRTKVGDRQATFIIGDTVKSLEEDINSFACSRSTIKLHREKIRQDMASFIKESFTPNSKLTVH
ncbi:unnamed protein product [Macrosiphum euphorbiae]|uniref:Uncharacterized protein n=1 Tax=Macrosiphum euphorbiae TaxID=13131 RepID=A0AAV0WMJ9_9HEMI|nr:unnamed protein product [Macrosiphum euphorbiae]